MKAILGSFGGFYGLEYIYPYKFAMKNIKILNSTFKYIEIILWNSSDSDY